MDTPTALRTFLTPPVPNSPSLAPSNNPRQPPRNCAKRRGPSCTPHYRFCTPRPFNYPRSPPRQCTRLEEPNCFPLRPFRPPDALANGLPLRRPLGCTIFIEIGTRPSVIQLHSGTFFSKPAPFRQNGTPTSPGEVTMTEAPPTLLPNPTRRSRWIVGSVPPN